MAVSARTAVWVLVVGAGAASCGNHMPIGLVPMPAGAAIVAVAGAVLAGVAYRYSHRTSNSATSAW